jgi:hypothetical protein
MNVVGHHLTHLEQYDLEPKHGDIVCDPFAGDGRYVRRAMELFGCEGYGGDLAPTAKDIPKQPWERTLTHLFEEDRDTYIITNPAFTEGARMLQRWVVEAEKRDRLSVLSMLVPVSFLEATAKRRHLFRDAPPSIVALVGRIQFEGPAIEARIDAGLRVGKAAMQYAYCTWALSDGLLLSGSMLLWDLAPKTGQSK